MTGLSRAVVLRLSALGDVLLTQPFCAKLAQTHRVTYVTSPPYARLVEQFEGVDKVIELPSESGAAGAKELGRSLASDEIERVFDLQNKVRTIALRRALGAADTRVMKKRTAMGALFSLLGNDPVIDDQHQVIRYLAMLDGDTPPGPAAPRLRPHPAWHEAADDFFDARNDVDPESGVAGGLLAVAPAATHATKGWGVERYAELVGRCVSDRERIVLVGGPNDHAALDAFISAFGRRDVIFDTRNEDLPTLAAILQRTRLLVGNDSGALHLARAVGVATVALFGPTSTTRWGPPLPNDPRHLVVRNEIECAPCSNHGDAQCPQSHHGCMNALTVQNVLDAVRRVEN
jgi:heptosyltransferase-2